MNRAFRDLEALIGNSSLPPVESWNPSKIGQIDIRIRSDGVWLHEEREFSRNSIPKLFATVLVCEQGGYYLKTPHEKLRIQVDDVPFVVVDFEAEGSGSHQKVIVSTNFDEHVYIDDAHRIYTTEIQGEKRPYVHIRSGLNAAIARSVYYRLANDLVVSNERDELVLWSCGVEFVLEHGAANSEQT